MVDDENEYDKEDDDDMVEHHGHKHSKEDIAKLQRIQKNFRQFLVDNADDMLTPELIAKIAKRLEKILVKAGLPNTLTNMKALMAGFEFGVMTQMTLDSDSARIFAGITKIVAEREKKVTKVDISASKPMEDGKKE